MRSMRGLKQADLAESSGLSEKTISAFENDKHLPTVDNFYSLCELLEADPYYIYYGENGTNASSDVANKLYAAVCSSYDAYVNYCMWSGIPIKEIRA